METSAQAPSLKRYRFKPSKALFTLFSAIVTVTTAFIEALAIYYSPRTLTIIIVPFIGGIAMALLTYFLTEAQAAPPT